MEQIFNVMPYDTGEAGIHIPGSCWTKNAGGAHSKRGHYSDNGAAEPHKRMRTPITMQPQAGANMMQCMGTGVGVCSAASQDELGQLLSSVLDADQAFSLATQGTIWDTCEDVDLKGPMRKGLAPSWACDLSAGSVADAWACMDMDSMQQTHSGALSNSSSGTEACTSSSPQQPANHAWVVLPPCVPAPATAPRPRTMVDLAHQQHTLCPGPSELPAACGRYKPLPTPVQARASHGASRLAQAALNAKLMPSPPPPKRASMQEAQPGKHGESQELVQALAMHFEGMRQLQAQQTEMAARQQQILDALNAQLLQLARK